MIKKILVLMTLAVIFVSCDNPNFYPIAKHRPVIVNKCMTYFGDTLPRGMMYYCYDDGVDMIWFHDSIGKYNITDSVYGKNN